jgi:hypothetical protein
MPTPAEPGTNRFRCNACGRYFNTRGELSQHETECRSAKQATAEGQLELAEQDSQDHQPNDQESKAHPFRHGREEGRRS